MTLPVFRMTPDRRRGHILPMVDQRVRVTLSMDRLPAPSDRVYVGTLVAYARPTTGTSADLLIVVNGHGEAIAHSAAQVFSVQVIE